MKVSRPAGVPLVSRMGPVVIKLLLIGGQQEQNGQENRVVIQCFYRSEYGRNGYRKRMHAIWDEMTMFNVTEQRLADQENNILKRKWLDFELEEMQTNIEDIGNGEVGLESDEDEG